MNNPTPTPVIPTFWNDGSSPLSYVWTLDLSKAILPAALLSLFLAFTISRVLTMAQMILYIIFRNSKTSSTLLDDQADAIAVNSISPERLLFSMLHLIGLNGSHGTKSNRIRLWTAVALIFLAMEAVVVRYLGSSFDTRPIPALTGQCGYPRRPDPNATVLLGQYLASQTESLSETASRCQQCSGHSEGDLIQCPGPSGQTFSWQVRERPGCWFGSKHCFPDFQSIIQHSSISPKDMGVARDSDLTVSFFSECSHLDTTPFVISNRSGGYTDYQFGRSRNLFSKVLDPPLAPNTTLRTINQGLPATAYQVSTFSYPQPQPADWLPSPFFLEHLESSDPLNKFIGPYELTLIVVERSFLTVGYNSDPLFQTSNESLSSRKMNLGGLPPTAFYPAANNASVIACRSQHRLSYCNKQNCTVYYGSLKGLKDYWSTGPGNKTSPNYVGKNAMQDFSLLVDIPSNAIGSTMFDHTISHLSSNKLDAQASILSGIQLDNTLKARKEITRWFGIYVLDYLYHAQRCTSGKNDFGSGVVLAQNGNGELHYMCKSTVHQLGGYVSLNITPVSIFLFSGLFLIYISYYVVPGLYLLASRVDRAQKPPLSTWSMSIQKALVSLELHSLEHLHRIAVEKSFNNIYLFRKTLGRLPIPASGMSGPVYGLRELHHPVSSEQYGDSQLRESGPALQQANSQRGQEGYIPLQAGNSRDNGGRLEFENRIYARWQATMMDQHIGWSSQFSKRCVR